MLILMSMAIRTPKTTARIAIMVIITTGIPAPGTYVISVFAYATDDLVCDQMTIHHHH